MKSKTHIAVGVTTSVMLLGAIKEDMAGIQKPMLVYAGFIGMSILGSILPDIDIKRSRANNIIKILSIFVLIIIGISLSGYSDLLSVLLENIGLYSYSFKIDDNYINSIISVSCVFRRRFLGTILFFIAVLLSKITGHRKFSHSILGLAVFSISVILILDLRVKGFNINNYSWQLVACFIMGYIMHILLDLLNKKGQRILFPLNKGFGFNIIKSAGQGDKILCMIFVALFFYNFFQSIIVKIK